MSTAKKPLALIIMDGWGYSEKKKVTPLPPLTHQI